MFSSTRHNFAAFLAVSATILAGSAMAVTAVTTPPPPPPAPTQTLTLKFDFNNIGLPNGGGLPLATNYAGSNLAGYGIGNIDLAPGISLGMTSTLQSVAPGASVAAVGAVATQTYNGEGRVAKTLGNSDGGVTHAGYDTFLVNNNFHAVQYSTTGTQTRARAGTTGGLDDEFTLNFTNFTVTGIQFDYEIFPDAACHRGSGCGPDMTVYAGINQIWHLDTLASTTMDPQALGTSEFLKFSGVTSLRFKDWPSEIGIDNMIISGCVVATAGGSCAKTVPEPGSLALLGLGAVALLAKRRKQRAA